MVRATHSQQGLGRLDFVVSALTSHIRDRDLGPGDTLPSEGDLARQLQVSRTVVREAFQSLAALHVIEVKAGRRATVAALDHSVMSPVIEHAISTDQISILQIYDVRRTVETRTVALAAMRRTNEEARRLIAHAEAMAANVGKPDVMMEHDLAFHLLIAQASRNPVYALIIGAFESATRQFWPINWRSRSLDDEKLAMLDTHMALAVAVRDGAPQVAQAHMARHFDDSIRALLAAGIV